MSMRRTAVAPAPQATGQASFAFHKLDAQLNTDATEGQLRWKDLSETEKSAASLGVDPTALKPIKFLNDAHYEGLLKANAIDSDLAKKLEAYKNVSLASSEP
jgi:hypothetical protein